MPHHTFIALWSNARRWDTGLDQRLLEMQRKLETVNHWLTEYAAQLASPLPFQGVLLAPEYYFTEPGTDRRPMSEADRLELEMKLMGLSAKFPRILIVPGTVFYRKGLIRDLFSAEAKFDPATGQRTLPKTTDPSRRDRILQKNQNYIANIPGMRSPFDKDLTSWIGAGFHAGNHPVPSLNQISQSLRDATKSPEIAKNVAYLLLGGRRIARIDKQADWGEAFGSSPDQLAFVPGTFQQCPDIMGYRFGMEICYDHGLGMLARRNVTPLHFHFVVSDWVESSLGNMAMTAGGYFAHASTNYLQSTLWRRTLNGALEDITLNDTYWMKRSTQATLLDGYLVPLPAPLAPPIPLGMKL